MDEVFWIEGEPAAKLAIVLRPEGGASLDAQMRQIGSAGVETIVSLLESGEASWLGLRNEGPAAAQAGIEFLSYPIPDVHVPPDLGGFRAFVAGLAQRLRAGQSIGVHCRGSIGRSTVTAACALIHLGWDPKAALKAIEAARGCPIPDTLEQRAWILNYTAEPKAARWQP